MEIGLLAPLFGVLVDRWGSRRLMFGGVVICGLGLILLSRISSLGMFYAAFVLMAIGTSTSSQTVIITAVLNWFHKNVGIVIGIVSSGFALGGLVGPWLGGWIYDVTGSYTGAFILVIIAQGASAIFIWIASPRKIRPVAGRRSLPT